MLYLSSGTRATYSHLGEVDVKTSVLKTTLERPTRYLFCYRFGIQNSKSNKDDRPIHYIVDFDIPNSMDAILPICGTEIKKYGSKEWESLTLEYLQSLIPNTTHIVEVFKDLDKNTLYKKSQTSCHNRLMESLVQELAFKNVAMTPDFQTAINLAIRHAHNAVVYEDSGEDYVYLYNGHNYINTQMTVKNFVTTSLLGLDGNSLSVTKLSNSTIPSVSNMFSLMLTEFNRKLKVNMNCPHVIRCQDAMFVNGVITETSANYFSHKLMPGHLYSKDEMSMLPAEHLLQWFRVLFIQNDCIHWILSLLRRTLEGRNHKLAVFLIGVGDSGKTTFLEFLKKTFGNKASCVFNAGALTEISGDTPKPSLVGLQSSNIAIAEECPKLNNETFKLLCGCESELHLRSLNSNGRSGVVTSTMFFAMNSWPQFSDVPDSAILNRFCPFRLNCDMKIYERRDYMKDEYFSAMLQLMFNSTWDIHEIPKQVLTNRTIFMENMTKAENFATMSKIDMYVPDALSTLVLYPSDFGISMDMVKYWNAILSKKGATWCPKRQAWLGMKLNPPCPKPCYITPLSTLCKPIRR